MAQLAKDYLEKSIVTHNGIQFNIFIRKDFDGNIEAFYARPVKDVNIPESVQISLAEKYYALPKYLKPIIINH